MTVQMYVSCIQSCNLYIFYRLSITILNFQLLVPGYQTKSSVHSDFTASDVEILLWTI